ncbi:uncharacterized protein LOC127749481 [Frankliniella occidentalis]|uniref:Uncharacterized protein LOC127749481 n=1 Tax=Frankliniella occidentalis TaxID=133901 RepID=A0A9C6WPK9_FRAOC|nr:uncharacterized protein LOC127749481 [Frankliniella occidentalis]
MYAFIMVLDERKFESMRLRVPVESVESGFPVTVGGKGAVVLGTGVTRAEAKLNGTEYYNRLCKWHGEEMTDWEFNTQDLGENSRTSPNRDEEKPGKRKTAASQQEGPLKRPKRSSE